MKSNIFRSSDEQAHTKSYMSSTTAYSLLLSLFAILFWILSPYFNQLKHQHSEIENLASRIEIQNTELQKQRAIEAEYWRKLKWLYQDGQLFSSKSSLDASKKLQTTLKSAANISAAKILQISPSQRNISSTVYEISLESNLTIQSDKLGDFLSALNTAVPRPRVTSISLRPTGGLRQPNDLSTKLSIQLALTQFAVNNPDKFRGIKITKRPTTPKRTIGLESIFSQAFRKRLRSPSLEYYRLGAITLSPDSKSILLSDKQTGRSIRLLQGDVVESWKLETITEKQAKFSRGDRKYTLELK
ncbi:MAG: hypothetical protein MK188_07820 [Gammaproteobacteria bacterium]|nr:hypothetical protein [Gammaproteobacteria bacterium]